MTFDLNAVPLVCPQTRAKLIRDGDRLISLDADCRLAYAIVHNIPCMIVEQATQLPVDEWQRIVEKQESSDPASPANPV